MNRSFEFRIDKRSICGWLDLNGYFKALGLAIVTCVVSTSSVCGQNQPATFRNLDQQVVARSFPVAPVIAQDQKPAEQTDGKTPVIDDARRTELLEFVRENHPELERLIDLLKEKRPAQYEAALRSLDKSVANLNLIKENHSELRYNQALDDWKLRSRIQLLSAQLSITDTPSRRQQLQGLIARQIDNRTKQLKAEAEKTSKRLEKLEAMIANLETNRDVEIQRQLDAVIKASERINAIRERDNKPEKAGDSDSQADSLEKIKS